MSQSLISARIDSTDKENFEKFCDSVGLNVSTAINMFVKVVIKNQSLPFEVKADPFYSPENMARLRKIIEDVESGKATLKEHDLIEV